MNKEKIFFCTLCNLWAGAILITHWIIVFIFLDLALSGAVSGLLFVTAFILSAGFTAGFFLIRHRKKRIVEVYRKYLNNYRFEDFFQNNLMISKEVSEMFDYLSEKLNKERYLSLSKKQAQYLALQNQINPHFLYNTLECIRSEALDYGIDGVASMTEALATFFRYTISNVDRLVTLEEELTNVENYYIIQKYRFGERLKISIEYGNEQDLSILELFMPKLILQPIVENSIYHGLEPKIGEGYVRIKIERTSQYLLIRISDNGIGMSPEVLKRLNDKLIHNSSEELTEAAEKSEGIAVQNVNNRIKLLFGEQYGIHINSIKNLGTDVEISLPVITKYLGEK